MAVNKGDVLIIPAPTEASKEGHRVTVRWQQSLRSNAEVPFFIQAEWYADANLAGAGTQTNDGNFEFTVDARHQFGQKNVAAEKRFFVWHNKDRKPYQHRFLETALEPLSADAVTKLARAFGQAQAADTIVEGFVVDYLLNV